MPRNEETRLPNTLSAAVDAVSAAMQNVASDRAYVPQANMIMNGAGKIASLTAKHLQSCRINKTKSNGTWKRITLT